MSKRYPKRLFMNDLLRIKIGLRALRPISACPRFLNQLVQFWVTETRKVHSGPYRRATELRRHKIVWIAIVSAPSHKYQRMFALFCAADELAPFNDLHFCAHANLCQV